jgi:cell division protein FtsB
VAFVPTRKQVLLAAFLAAMVVAALAVFSPQGLAHYRRLSNEAARLHAENEVIRAENQRRRQELEALKANPAYQEKVVREELGFVKPGEKLLIVEGTAGVPEGASPSSGPPQRP